MLEIGVQTKGLLPERSSAEAFSMIRRVGFSHVDFNMDVFLQNYEIYAGDINSFFDRDTRELKSFFAPYLEAMEQCGITPSQMHAPYPVRVEGKESQNQYLQTVVIPKSLEIAAMMKVPWVVVHPFKMQYLHGRERERQENLAYFKSLIPLLKRLRVGVCIENLYESVGRRIVEGVCADPGEAVWYLDTLNDLAGEERFGFCLDTGHLQLVKREPSDYIRRMGSRLKVLHLHENDGVGDLHQMPFSFGKSKGDGLDWDAVIRGLREIRYQGVLSFETFPCMNSFPRGVSESVLKMIHETGVYMAEKIEREL